MAGVSVIVDLQNLDPVEASLRNMVAGIEDATDLMDEIGSYLEASTQDRFERGVAPGGVPWQPSQRVLKEGGQTLVDKGRLRDSVTHEASRHQVQIGTNVIYGRIHQLGGEIEQDARSQTLAVDVSRNRFISFAKARRRKRGVLLIDVSIGERKIKMPARPYLGVSKLDELEIADIVTDYLRRLGN